MKQRLLDLIIGLAIGAALLWFLQPKSVDVKDILKENDKRSKKAIDSLIVIIEYLQEKDNRWADTIRMVRIQKQEAAVQSELYRAKYETLKRTPAPRLSDSLISVKLSELYPR